MMVMGRTIYSKAYTSSDGDRGRAESSIFQHVPGMDESGWRGRLKQKIEDSGKSLRQVSLDAGRAAGYVHGILYAGKDPTIDNIMAVCDAVPVSPLFVLYGLDASPRDLEILRALHENPDARAAILALIARR